MAKKNPIAKELRTPKYRPRIVEDKRRKLKEKIQRREVEKELPPLFL